MTKISSRNKKIENVSNKDPLNQQLTTVDRVRKLILKDGNRNSRKYYVLYNLFDVHFAIDSIFRTVLDDPKWNFDKLGADFHEIYYHTNLTWNSRKAPFKGLVNMSDKNHKKWIKFPEDFL